MALAGWLLLVSAAVSALPATPPRSAHAAAPPATHAPHATHATPSAAALRPPPATPPSLPHSAALAAASSPPTGASVAAALTALEANKDTDEEAEVEAADGVPPASAMHSLPGVADVLPLDLDALWPFNDSFHLSHLDEIDQPHGEGNGVSGEAGSAGGGERAAADASAVDNGPVFDADLVTNVTAQLGGPAFLRCRVRNLGERVVSWIRRRDWHILTSGVFTYTNDERFQVVHFEGSDEWTLHIKYVQKRDNGTYECQVATGGGVISHYFNLHVMVPAAFILGSGEYHIGEGSTISLVCIIENSPSPPQYVFWYHNDNMINYESVRGGVTVSTEPGPKTHSRLLIHQATRADSGNYTCRAPNTEDDTIYVFVSQGCIP